MTRIDDLLRGVEDSDDPMHQILEALAARRRPEVTVEIVCEGPCNPYLHDYTQRVEHYCRSGRAVPPPPSSLLRHTPHVGVGGAWYRCTVCGTRRKF